MVAFVRPYGVELAKLECGPSLTSLLGLLFAWHYRSFACDHGTKLVTFYWIPLTLDS